MKSMPIALGAILITLQAQGAVAAAPVAAGMYSQHTMSVTHADLDLRSTQGRETLDRRLASAVRAVCGDSDIRSIKETRDMLRCRNDAREKADALRQLALARSANPRAVALTSTN